MSSHLYEVALFGDFFAKDLKPILNRIALHSESSNAMHTREVVFEPLDAQQQRDKGQDPIMLRARKELLDEKPTWVLYSYLKPESVKTYPEATVRPWATVSVVGDALDFASALGYVQRNEIYKRGYVFRKGQLVIQMFQQEHVHPVTHQPIPAQVETLWEVEVKTATPVRSTLDTPLENAKTPLAQAVQAVLEVQLLMKGLLDLRRQDL